MSNIRNAMAKKEATQEMATAQPKKVDPVRSLVTRMAPAIQAALPKHMDAERFGRIMITTIRNTPELMNCLNTSRGQATLLGALMQCAQLGLDPGPLGHAYIIPFKRSPRGEAPYVEAVFVPGYKGLIDLARRSGHIVTIYANPIREGEEFTATYGVGGTIHHVPNFFETGKVLGYYAFAELKGGGHQFVVMSKREVEEHRSKHSKSKYNSPWDSDFDEMAKKTLIRRLVKILPMTADYATAFTSDERSVTLHDDGQMIDVEPVAEDYAPPAAVHQAQNVIEVAPDVEEEKPLATYSRYGKWKDAANKIHGLASDQGINPDKVFSGIARSFHVPEIANVPTEELDKIATRLDHLSTDPAAASGEIPEHVAELMGYAAE